jgi:hypothetical protein
MVNLVLEEEDTDLIGRGGEGCAGRISRVEEEEEDFFFFLSSLEPAERAFTEASLWLSLGPPLELSFGLFLELSFPFAISYPGTRLANWLLPFNGTRDPELSVSKRDSTGESHAAQNT